MKPKYTDNHRYPHGYRLAVDTDIRESMERRRKQIEAEQGQTAANKAEAEAKVEQLPKRKVTK